MKWLVAGEKEKLASVSATESSKHTKAGRNLMDLLVQTVGRSQFILGVTFSGILHGSYKT